MAEIVNSLIQCGCGCGCELLLVLKENGAQAVGTGFSDGVNPVAYSQRMASSTCDYVLYPSHPDYDPEGSNERTCTIDSELRVENPVWTGPISASPEDYELSEATCEPGAGCDGIGVCDGSSGDYAITGCDPTEYEGQGTEMNEGFLVGQAAGAAQETIEKIVLFGGNEESLLIPTDTINEYLLAVGGATIQALNYAYNFIGIAPWALVRAIAGYNAINWQIKWSNEGCGPPFTIRYTKTERNETTYEETEDEIEEAIAESMGEHDFSVSPGHTGQIQNIVITFEAPLT